jgi:hypothetical protein
MSVQDMSNNWFSLKDSIYDTVTEIFDDLIPDDIRKLIELAQYEAIQIFSKCNFWEEVDKKERIRSVGKLFNSFTIKWKTLFFPREKTVLSISRIIDILKAGIDITLPNWFEVAYDDIWNIIWVKKSSRKDRYISDVSVKIPISLNPIKYKKLIENEKEIKKQLNALFTRTSAPEFNNRYKAIWDIISWKVTEVIVGWIKVPSSINDEIIIPETSIILPRNRNDWEEHNLSQVDLLDSLSFHTHSLTLSSNQKIALSLQRQWLLPSVFNLDSLKQISWLPQVLKLLIDKSNSTKENEIYKVVDIAARAAIDFLTLRLPNLQVSGIHYSNRVWDEIITIIEGFTYPDWWTNYEKAFNAVVSYLWWEEYNWHSKMIINLSDGLPTESHRGIFYSVWSNLEVEQRVYEDTLNAARKIPSNGISFWQIIFWHDIRLLTESIQSQVLRDLWAPSTVTNVKEYEEYFTKITRAWNWWQILLWVTKELAAMIVSYYDVILWEWLLKTPEFRYLLENNW